jgi:integrase/recombinase XerD
MSNFRNQMEQDMQLRGFSPKTQYKYLAHLRQFEEFFHHPAEELGQEELRNFLHYLIKEKNVSSSYANGVYSGLKFFFETTLGRSWDMTQIPRVKKAQKLPVVISREEIKKLLAVTTNLKFKTMFMVAYSAGLRVNEITHLKVSDIDSGQMQILVREGKGKIDRYSLLSEVILKFLREYWKQYRPEVWLFPGKIPGQPMSNRAFQDAFQKARNKSGINTRASIHSLRHSFATRLLENGTDIVRIQHLMGHARIGTTTLYLHLAKSRILEVKSPLDALLEEDKDEF